MTEECPLSKISAGQTADILDHAPVAVYVSAADTKELLYVNRLARELFFSTPCEQGTTCYQLAGFSQPCSFCTADRMKWSELTVRKFRHPISERIYQLSGRLIDWEGRTAHIEYISDITEAQTEEDQRNALSRELQDTFRSIPCGLCVYQVDGEKITPVYHNPAFYEIMGYSVEHILSVEQQTDYLGVHPEDLLLLQEKIQDILQSSAGLHHVYRVWNDRKQDYCWIQLEGSMKQREDGSMLFYGVYSDVSEQQRLEHELKDAYESMQDIIKAIPGGVAIYKVSDIFETRYFSEGVPELTGYTQDEYRELSGQDASERICREDRDMVMAKIRDVIGSRRIATFEFRKQHRDGQIVWVRVRVKWIGEEDGCPLLHCVFHNITDTKEAQLELDHLINSIPGGIASYLIEGGKFIPTFYTDGVLALSGHTRQEFEELVREDALDIIYEGDRGRVMAVARAAIESGGVLDVSYRMRHKNGNLIWIHLNGRRMGPLAETMRFYAVFTGMSEEALLFQNIANETADGIYVIDKESYDLLYANESRGLFNAKSDCVGQKCYEALHGRQAPCEFCLLGKYAADGKEHEMQIEDTDHFYSASFRETNWSGIPAYVQYVRNVTEEVQTRREKERLEQYFETVIRYLPGGVAVVRYQTDGSMKPEFLSDGFARMTGMTLEEAWQMYGQDAMAGVHPDDVLQLYQRIQEFMAGGDSHCEMVYRLRKGARGYLWIRNTISVIHSSNGENRIYANYHDVTREREEQEQLRQQYNDLIMQHYQLTDPNVLILGHCNITQNRILEIRDQTDSGLLAAFSPVREAFFTGIAGLVAAGEERQAFMDTYLNEPSLAAYQSGCTELKLDCFIKLPKEKEGRYARFKVNLVQEPETGDITGILTVTDITEQLIADQILHRLSVASYDYVVDLDLNRDQFTILAGNKEEACLPQRGSYSTQVALMLKTVVVPKDREQYSEAFDPDRMRRRLSGEGTYTFSFSIRDRQGVIRTKSMSVSGVDLRIGRVCLVRTDVTDILSAERRAQDALEKALVQAEEASRAKSDFLSSMSHDIRTPMNAIIGMTALAFAHLDDQERLEDCLQKISFSSKHLLNLINDILDMSKIERAKIVLNREKIILPQLVEQLSAMMKPQAENAGLELSFRMSDFLHPCFYGDPLRINQVLINILGNAIKFTPKGGKVEFWTEELSSAGEGHVRCRFTVNDTGSGMSEDFLQHIFEPFTRSSKASNVEGTGLGLSITKGLVDLMHGDLSVESALNQGSTFRVELEFEAASDEGAAIRDMDAGAAMCPDETMFEGRCFLVAEDNAINSEILCELMQMFGASCVVKTDGVQTVRAFLDTEPGTYDAVLMDIQMPEMNGYEAARTIRAQSRADARTIPIIAMTANAFEEDIQTAMASGMSAHVAKPIDIQLLLAALDRVLGIK